MLPFLVLQICVAAILAADWNYISNDKAGPENWGDVAETCRGPYQSPVNINTTDLIYDESLANDPFIFERYGTMEREITLGNSGYSVQLLFEGESSYVTGGHLPGTYTLFQIHFHWGATDFEGSEHAMDKMFYPLEMHMVHFNNQLNISTALVSPNGLAVLGFFFVISEKDNMNLAPIIDNLEKVKYLGDETKIETFPITTLMEINPQHFYRYAGSLTTPGCYQSVIWTVFNDKIPISHRQMEKLRMLKSGEIGDPGDDISGNFRPLQPRNGRPMYTTAPWQDRMLTVVSSASRTTGVLSSLIPLYIYFLMS